jgi:hypothetical protein
MAWIFLAASLVLAGCSGPAYQAGHVKRALDPAGFPQAASGSSYEAAVVRATEGTGGYDYSGTRLLPVLLVLKSKGGSQPQVILEDVRGLAGDIEYLIYSSEEALRLASAANMARRAGKAAKSGAAGAGIGAALGAGAGTLAYLLGYKNPAIIWQGAAVGGAAGALAGVASGEYSPSKEQISAIRADLDANQWQEDPLAPGSTRMGYLLLPEGLGIKQVRLMVRAESGVETVTLAIAKASDYAVRPGQAPAPEAAASAPLAGASQPKPAPAKPAPSNPAKPPAQAPIQAQEQPEEADEPERIEI